MCKVIMHFQHVSMTGHLRYSAHINENKSNRNDEIALPTGMGYCDSVSSRDRLEQIIHVVHAMSTVS